jgi:signal transduction histidine kinase
VDERREAAFAEARLTAWDMDLTAVNWSEGVDKAADVLLCRVAAGDRCRVEAALAAALSGTGHAVTVEFRGAGERGWFRATGRIFRDRDGLPRWVSGVTQDLSASKGAAELLERERAEASAASQAKSEFLACMSHEIRTPLAAILGFCEVLEDPDMGCEERGETVRIIKRNGELLCQIINNVLDLSKIEAGRLEVERLEFGLRDLVQDVCASLEPRARAKDVELRGELRDPLPLRIVTDPTRVKQILINIVGNAVKFTDQGSIQVTVRAKRQGADPRLWQLEVTVKDSGIGFTQTQRQQLFQPFAQAGAATARKYGGSGLGLMLSRKLARTLGGDLVLLESAPGAGSTFCLRLPVAEALA